MGKRDSRDCSAKRWGSCYNQGWLGRLKDGGGLEGGLPEGSANVRDWSWGKQEAREAMRGVN